MFRDRIEAGRQLAEHLLHLKDQDVVVLGLPRGGVPVAHQVALALDAPLDVIVVRKLGVPYQPELAMGAIGEEGVRIIDPHIVSMAGVSAEELAEVRLGLSLGEKFRAYDIGQVGPHVPSEERCNDSPKDPLDPALEEGADSSGSA